MATTLFQRVVLARDDCGERWEYIALVIGRSVGVARQLHQRAWIELRCVLRPKLEGGALTRREGRA